jgi:hypothetical protein
MVMQQTGAMIVENKPGKENATNQIEINKKHSMNARQDLKAICAP